MLLFFCLLLAFTYRLRGGGFYRFDGSTTTRLIWAASLSIAYGAMYQDHYYWYINIIFYLLAYAAVVLPHGAFMDMGRSIPQERGYFFFIPSFTVEEWIAMPLSKRMWFDIQGMALIKLCSALILFLPMYFLTTATLTNLVSAVFILTIFSTLAYVVCYYIPINIGGTWRWFGDRGSDVAEKYTTCWAEILVGVTYAFALHYFTIK